MLGAVLSFMEKEGSLYILGSFSGVRTLEGVGVMEGRIVYCRIHSLANALYFSFFRDYLITASVKSGSKYQSMN